MIYRYNQNYLSLAKRLRKNMTKEEKHLWYDFLKNLPVTVNRQKNIGNYIVDFYIATHRIVIEIDGIQHETEDHKNADIQRDAELRKLNICVLRYTNEDIHQRFSTVCQDILDHLHLTAKDIHLK